MAWSIVFAKGKQGQIKGINRLEFVLITLTACKPVISLCFAESNHDTQAKARGKWLLFSADTEGAGTVFRCPRSFMPYEKNTGKSAQLGHTCRSVFALCVQKHAHQKDNKSNQHRGRGHFQRQDDAQA